MLVAFDFDGTLSGDEMVVLLGERAGRGDEIAAITRRAMDGELSYGESLRERVSLLSGLPVSDADDAFDRVHLRDGAGSLLGRLRESGTATAILTGGFEDGVARALAAEGAAVDRVVANRLVEDGPVLAGEVRGPLVDGGKDDALREVAADLGASLEETVAVGDGANDVPMLDAAGTAIGFRPKPPVVEHCDAVVRDVEELEDVLSDLGAMAPRDG